MNQPQKQTFNTSSEHAKFEIVPRSDGTGNRLAGYAIVWNVLSSDRGGYKVRVRPGSVSIPPEGCMALYDHVSSYVIGNTANGTLEMIEDDYGMKVFIDLPDTTTGRDVMVLVRDRYVTGMSFGTFPIKVEDVVEGNQKVKNYISILVDEITVTATPAFGETIITAVQPVLTPIRTFQTLKLEEDRFLEMTT